ncbi:TetR/AcrR family transcriptional regulator [Parvularcula maris]|uniref:TetR/AcrR family transcriptional regulator n=1 Tax=Parvularcula maris TaxID=2965077 RepID=A0A9X2L7H0_9PROT|nr:TetR/AcrR family transcriptional regulator [Parvularcula maris]
MPSLTQRPPPRQQRAEAKRQSILDAAERVLVGRTPSELTTKEIAAEAGVPIGSLYRYFANLDDLLGAMMERFNEETLEALATAGMRSDDWRGGVRLVMGVIKKMHQRHPIYGAVAAALTASPHTGEPVRRALMESLGQALPHAEAKRIERLAITAYLIVEAAERHYHDGGRQSPWLFDEAETAIEAYLGRYLGG